jgi:hypothetical protein
VVDIRAVPRYQDDVRLLGQRTCTAHGNREPSWEVAPVDADPGRSRYRQGMPPVTVPAVTIRTTSDSNWRALGIVTGMGLSPELALKELKQDSQTQAEKAAEPHSTPDAPARAPYHPPPTAKVPTKGTRRATTPAVVPMEWRFEVVDVRLAPAVIEGKNGWLAYGTLLSEGEKPRPVPVQRKVEK